MTTVAKNITYLYRYLVHHVAPIGFKNNKQICRKRDSDHRMFNLREISDPVILAV